MKIEVKPVKGLSLVTTAALTRISHPILSGSDRAPI
jgi:hypothetical protein